MARPLQSRAGGTLDAPVFRFTPEADPQSTLKLKIEINTREHESLFGVHSYEGKAITRAMAEQRMLEKLTRSLTEDIAPLLPAGIRFDEADALRAFERVWTELVARLKGDPWKSTDKVVAALREKGYPALLRPMG